MNFQLDVTSFFIGLLSGLVIGFLVTRIRSVFPQILTFLKGRIRAVQSQLTAGVDQYLRQMTIKKAQQAHLASRLFALDEILIPPRILPHLSFTDPAALNFETNVTSQAILFLPGWADLASQFSYPSFSLSEILSAGANIFILGKPGAGKSVALAHLACQIARKQPSAGSLSAMIPVYLHYHELLTTEKTADPLETLIQTLIIQLPRIIQSRLPGFIISNARAGNLILILDGLDELFEEAFEQAGAFLKAIHEKYPLVQIVTTAPSFSWDSLPVLGMIPVSIASWNYDERSRFINQWSRGWHEHISPQVQKKLSDLKDLDQRLVTHWISPEPTCYSPFEWTLRLWSLHSNDLVGNNGPELLASYTARFTKASVSQAALANLAEGFISSKTGFLTSEEADKALEKVAFSPETHSPRAGTGSEGVPQKPNSQAKSQEKIGFSFSSSLSVLISRGFLKETRPGMIIPNHPILMGYLASLSMAGNPPETLNSRERFFLYETLLLRFLVAQNSCPQIINQMLLDDEDPFHENLLVLLDWLKDAPPAAGTWRTEVLKKTVQALHDPQTPDITKHTLLACLTGTNDANLSTMFRQLLFSPNEIVRRLSALGCGCIQDIKIVPDLARLLEDASTDTRICAVLALGIIRDPSALKTVVTILQQSEEILRQAAAETLAFRGEEGPKVLRESHDSPNLLLRRAVVYGLMEIKEDWALKLMEKIAVEDGQWVVRSAASHVLEAREHPHPFVPIPLPLPSDTSWLIEYASRQGTGIIPGKSPVELLLKILESGTPEEKLATLTYLKSFPEEDIINRVNEMAVHESGIIREYASLILWCLVVSKLPAVKN